MINILVHGSGHKATSWNETISYMKSDKEILCPDLSSILNGKVASYSNLYNSFAEYCNNVDGQINLCGLSLGGILALNYAIDFPDKVNTLVLIGTPHKVPKVMFGVQRVVSSLLPKLVFKNMAFNKKDNSALGNSMRNLDFSSRVKSVKCSTLIICGKKDGANIKSAHFLAENIKTAKLAIMEDVGHVVNEESPKDLAKELNDFYHLPEITK